MAKKARKKTATAIGVTEARRLVADKFDEERAGVCEGETTDRYRDALVTSPATMAVAIYELSVAQSPKGIAQK